MIFFSYVYRILQEQFLHLKHISSLLIIKDAPFLLLRIELFQLNFKVPENEIAFIKIIIPKILQKGSKKSMSW